MPLSFTVSHAVGRAVSATTVYVRGCGSQVNGHTVSHSETVQMVWVFHRATKTVHAERSDTEV